MSEELLPEDLDIIIPPFDPDEPVVKYRFIVSDMETEIVENNPFSEDTDYSVSMSLQFDIIREEKHFEMKEPKVEQIGHINFHVSDDDWYNWRSKVRSYDLFSEPPFVALNSFEEQIQGTAVRPSQEKDYCFVREESGETNVLVDGRIAELNNFCLLVPYLKGGIPQMILKEINGYLKDAFKVDFWLIRTLNAFSDEEQKSWNDIIGWIEEDGVKLAYWGVPSNDYPIIDSSFLEKSGFVKSMDKVWIGKPYLLFKQT